MSHRRGGFGRDRHPSLRSPLHAVEKEPVDFYVDDGAEHVRRVVFIFGGIPALAKCDPKKLGVDLTARTLDRMREQGYPVPLSGTRRAR